MTVAVLAASALLWGCGAEADPPDRIRERLEREWAVAQPARSVPQVATAEWNGPCATPSSPPMPAGEVRGRESAAEPRRLQIAVGRSAAGMVGPALQEAFEREHPDVDLVVRVVGERETVDLVQIGQVDFGVLNGSLSARERHAGLRQDEIGVELFGLAVSVQSSALGLSRSQVRRILTGDVTSWQQVGVDGGEIVVLAPADRELTDRAARWFLEDAALLPTAVRVADPGGVQDHLRRNPDAIALVRLATPGADGQRVLPIDNTPAMVEAFGYGSYPFGSRVHVITTGRPADDARTFLAFVRGERGRAALSGVLSRSR